MAGWIPQLLTLFLLGFIVGVNLSRHGQRPPATGRHSVWRGIGFAAILGGLLWWGGFFAWP